VEAALCRNGDATFDQDLFLTDDPNVGSELIATRAYDRPLLGAHHRGAWVKTGAVDLHNNELAPVRQSHLFRSHAINGFVPISLLPGRVDWWCDVGIGAISAHPHQAPGRYDTDPHGESYYCGAPASHSAPPVGHPGVRCQSDRDTFHCEGGARIDLQRTVELERIR